jgi:solute carrier family 36 (proton-coupled amino acid transporter)
MIFLAILSNYCIRVLLHCANELEPKHGKLSLGDIGGVIFGPKGRVLVDLVLVLTQVGFCCVYVVFISVNLHSIFGSLESWQYAVLLVPCFSIVCWIRELKWLAFLSLVGQVALVAGLSIIVVFAALSAVTITPETYAVRFSGIPIFFGIALFSYEGVGVILPMRRSMKDPQAFGLVLDAAFIVMTILELAFGVIGYAGFGDQVNPNSITMNLPKGTIWAPIAQVLLATSIFCTYPVQMFPVIAILEEVLFKKVPWLALQSGPTQEWSRNGLRSLLVAFTSVIAISIPYFSLFVSLVGSLGSSSLAYIIPCLFHLKLFGRRSSRLHILLNSSIVVFGILGAILCSSLTLWELYKVMFDSP